MKAMIASNLKVETRPMTDAPVAATYGDSERQALERVYDQYAAGLLRYARALLGSPDDAEDAVQEVFIRLARNAAKIERIIDPQKYLLRATRNAAYGLLRSKKRRELLEERALEEITLVSQERRGDEVEALLAAFADLSPEQREVMALKVFYGLTFKEIAAVIGKSQNTVSSRYRYAIEKLRREFVEG